MPAAPPASKRLKLISPVPSDIEIAQAATPLPIADVAARLGLQPDDFFQWGPTAAKVGGKEWVGGAAGAARAVRATDLSRLTFITRILILP